MLLQPVSLKFFFCCIDPLYFNGTWNRIIFPRIPLSSSLSWRPSGKKLSHFPRNATKQRQFSQSNSLRSSAPVTFQSDMQQEVIVFYITHFLQSSTVAQTNSPQSSPAFEALSPTSTHQRHRVTIATCSRTSFPSKSPPLTAPSSSFRGSQAYRAFVIQVTCIICIFAGLKGRPAF